MLEILNKTINGEKIPPQEFTLNCRGRSQTGTPSSFDTSERSRNISIKVPLQRTIIKPKYILTYLRASARSETTNARYYAVYLSPYNGVTFAEAVSRNNYYLQGYFMFPLVEDNDTTFTYTNTIRNTSQGAIAHYEHFLGFSDFNIYDIDNFGSNIIGRQLVAEGSIATLCPNPETDFDTFGTELTPDNYSTISVIPGTLNYSSTYTNGFRPMTIFKLSELNDVLNKCKYVLPITNVSGGGNYNGSYPTTIIQCLLWNFETSTWDHISNHGATWIYFGGGGYQPNPCTIEHFANYFSSQNFTKYIKNGEIYMGLQTSSATTTTQRYNLIIGYIGLMTIQGPVWI